jgi:hypothetical protein
MRYMLMITVDDSAGHQLPPDEAAAAMAEYGAFNAEAGAAGALLGGERLRPSSTATTVRVRDGETLITDGPFAETKEHLGGFYLIEAADLDAAVAWARKIPGARYGSVEIRPVWEMEA